MVVALALVGSVVAVVVSHNVTAPTATSAAPPDTNAKPSAPTSATGGSTDEEHALAAKRMLALPAQAAEPQALTAWTAGPPIEVPKPTTTIGQWVPGGFPDTPAGALGQLKALDETTMSTADPEVYARGYRESAEPGAPDPKATGLWSLLTSLRSRAQLPTSGSVPGLTATYEITHGQVKGTASGGRYVVACVLGQFSVSINGQVTSRGIGDCQAMRWTGSQWRIASGTLAAPAPSAWPGSPDAVKAGYRELV
ncbi:hypothetical protein [Saccharothrix sp.]|uniref:hypothetical protein n=1 Tax=Saccharothrix sp. TaxID=1873460 RepID=UPI002811F295|nr:hypothetical protein [Saccharothrix sp.]